MKKLYFLVLCFLLPICAYAESIFYTDEKCDGKPILFDRYVVDKARQTVLLQVGEVHGNKITETGALYLESCNVTDSKNFICNDESLKIKTTMSKGTLIRTVGGNPEKKDYCTYIKGFWGFKKVADANIKDMKSPPVKNK
jgi:hypothetical protein